MAKKSPAFSLTVDDFGTLCICSVRYALGRQSYMPRLVQDIIRPQLPILSNKDLFVIERDIAEADKWGGYGHPVIDEPGWMRFLADIRAEKDRRNNT